MSRSHNGIVHCLSAIGAGNYGYRMDCDGVAQTGDLQSTDNGTRLSDYRLLAGFALSEGEYQDSQITGGVFCFSAYCEY